MKLLSSLVFAAAAATMLAGCTRSMDYSYTPNGYDTVANRSIVVGVAELEDKRSWVKAGDEKSKSFFMSAGQWKFGLTNKGTDYAPISQIVRDVLVQELTTAGLTGKAVNGMGQSAVASAQGNGLNYVITGNIESFEVGHDMGFVTVTARRQVGINLSLYNAQGALVDGPANYSNFVEMNEGMGVMHSTNIDKLFNETLRPVMKKVVERTKTKVAGLTGITVNVAVNGTVYSRTYSVAGL